MSQFPMIHARWLFKNLDWMFQEDRNFFRTCQVGTLPRPGIHTPFGIDHYYKQTVTVDEYFFVMHINEPEIAKKYIITRR